MMMQRMIDYGDRDILSNILTSMKGCSLHAKIMPQLVSISSPGDPLRPARPVDVLVDVHLQERYAIRYICVQMISLFSLLDLKLSIEASKIAFQFIQEFLIQMQYEIPTP